MYKTFHSWFALHIFKNFMEKESLAQFYGRFDCLSQTHEVTKLCLDVSEVIHRNKHTYANCGLHVNF